MPKDDDRIQEMLAENERLKSRLQESEEVLDAIRFGRVDAVVVSGPHGDQVYTLKGSDQVYRLLFETMNEGAAILGSDGTVFFCNTRLSSMLRTPMEAILGGSMLRFVTAEDSPSFESLLKRGLEEHQETEFTLQSQDGNSVSCHISTSPLQVEDSSHICMIVTDITDRKKAEEDLRKSKDELELRVQERTAELKAINEKLLHEIAERIRAEAALLDSQRELSSRQRISEVFLSVSEDELYGKVLDVVQDILESPLGIFGYVDQDGDMVCPSLTTTVWENCRIGTKSIVFPRETWGGIWSKAFTEKVPLYSNEGFRVPEGHVAINSHLVNPIVYRGELIGTLQVSNKEGGYTDKDKHLLARIGTWLAPILAARLLRDREEKKRRIVEEDLRKLNANLEEQVEIRTHALIESEERFRNVFEQGPIGIAVVALDYRWVTVNAALCEMLGYSEDELTKLTFVDITHPDDIEADVGYAVKLSRGEIPSYKMEKRYIRKNGEAIWIHLTVSIVSDEQGKALYYLSMIEDISERKQSNETLRRSEHTLRSLVDGNPESLFLVDTEGIVLVANKEVARRLGTTVSELIGSSLYDLLPPDVAEERKEHVQEVIRTGKPVRFEDTRFGRTMDNHFQPIMNAEGKVVSLALLGIDITNLRKAEEVQKRLATAIEQSAEAVVITDPDGVIQYVNPAVERISGFERSEVIGKTPRIFKSGEHDKAFYGSSRKTVPVLR